MLTRDMAGGLAATLIGAVYLFYAYQLRASALDDSMGPGGMPQAYGWLLVGLGLILCAQAAITRMRQAAPAEGEGWSGQGRRVLWAAGLLAIGIVYLLVVDTLGYLISIALLLVAVTVYQGAPAGVRVVAIGVGGALVLWVLFSVVLGVSMPAGLLRGIGW